MLTNGQITIQSPPQVTILTEADPTPINLPPLSSRRISLSSVEGPLEQDFWLPINISQVDGLLAADLVVSYDPFSLNFQRASLTELTEKFELMVNTNIPGQLILPISGQIPISASGQGEILKLFFQVNQSLPVGTVTSVELTEALLWNVEGRNYPVTLTAGQVTVVPKRIPPPKLEINPTEVNFGSLFLGETVVRNLQLSNSGDLDLLISNLQINNPQLKVETEVTKILPSQSQEIRLFFSPVTVGQLDGQLTFASNDPNSPLTIPIQAEVNQPLLTLSRELIDFGSAPIGLPTTAKLVVTNPNSIDLTITEINPSQPQIAADIILPLTIPSGRSHQIEITLTPTEALSILAQIDIISLAGTKTVKVLGMGTLAPAQLVVDRNPIDFGPVKIGQSDQKSLILSNSGQQPLTITGISLDQPTLATDQTAIEIQPNQQLELPITFTPTSAELTFGQLVFITNDPELAEISIAVSGLGAQPILKLDSDILDFGAVPPNQKIEKKLILTNQGTADLVVNSVAAPLTDSLSFTPQQPLILKPQYSQQLTVTLQTPDSIEKIGLNFTISSNDPETPSKMVLVTGQLVGPVLVVKPTSINFGLVGIEEIAEANLSLVNNGNAKLTIYAIKSDSDQFILANPFSNFNLNPQEEAIIQLAFQPSTVEPAKAQLSISSNGGQQTINLSGHGSPTSGIRLSLSQINFGSLIAGQTVEQQLKITNTGQADLEVSNITSDWPEVLTLSQTKFSLSAAKSTVVTLTLTPDQAGQLVGKLKLSSNAPKQPQIFVPLQAEVVYPSPEIVQLIPGVGSQSEDTLVTILGQNFLPGIIVTIGQTELTQPNLVSAQELFVKAPKGIGTVNVSVTNPDLQTAILVNGFRYAKAVLSASTNRLDFGQVLVGKQIEAEVKVTNLGEETLTLTNIESSDQAFTVETSQNQILPDTSSLIKVTFSPLQADVYNGLINISSNGGKQQIAVTGTGSLSPPVADQLVISVDPISLPANGQAQATVKVKVKSEDQRAVTDEIILLTASQGKIDGRALHQQNGLYTATYIAGQVSQSVMLTATSSNGKTAEFELKLTPWQISAQESSLSVSGGLRQTVGQPCQIKIQLRTPEGIPFSGQQAHLEFADSVSRIQGPSVTDQLGLTMATVTSTQAGPKLVKVWFEQILIGTVVIDFLADLPDQIEIKAQEMPISFGQSTRLTVSLKDRYDNPVTDADPVLSTTGGRLESTQPSHLTDGQYTTVFTAPEEETEITVQVKVSPLPVKNYSIQIQKPTFSLKAISSKVSVSQGEAAGFLLQLEAEGQYMGGITLLAADLPIGASARFDPKMVELTQDKRQQSLQLTIDLPEGLVEGIYEPIILGISNNTGQSKTLRLQLMVQPPSHIKTLISMVLPPVLSYQQPFEVSGELLPVTTEPVQLSARTIQLHLETNQQVIENWEIKTDQQGKYRITTRVDQVGAFDITVSFDGDSQFAPSQRSQKVEVLQASSEINFLSPDRAELGQEYLLEGILNPNLGSKSVTLKVVNAENRVQSEKLTTNVDGSFKYPINLVQEGLWYFTAGWSGNSYYRKAQQTLELQVIKQVGKVIIVLAGVNPTESTDNQSQIRCAYDQWCLFNELAEQVHRTFVNRYFDPKKDIYFLSTNPGLTANADGETTLKNLQHAITSWAAPQVNSNVPLYIYLLSHGLEEQFLLQQQPEIFLNPIQLSSWLDIIPADTPTTIVVESCYSGSFVPNLAGPQRTIIASSSKDQRAVIKRTSSFSRFFFGRIEQNQTIWKAFDSASSRMSRWQEPQIDADGDGITNKQQDGLVIKDRRIPANLPTASLPPVFVNQLDPIKLPDNQTSFVFEVELAGIPTDGVVATIFSPRLDLNQELTSWNQLDQYIEEKDLTPKGQNRYQLVYDKFNHSGEYTVTFQAINQDGLAESIQTTVSVSTPSQLKGDVNQDQMVNIFDLVIAAGQFGQTGNNLMGDINSDGLVNIFDLVIVASNFGQSLVTIAPSMMPQIVFSQKQKTHISQAVGRLESNSNRSSKEQIVLNLLKAILLERLPTQTKLLTNYPNPFNPETWIPFQLNQESNVIINIYDVVGHSVRQLDLGRLPAGRYLNAGQAAYWNGKTNSGEMSASGTYFYHLQADGYIETKRMILVK